MLSSNQVLSCVDVSCFNVKVQKLSASGIYTSIFQPSTEAAEPSAKRDPLPPSVKH